MSIIGDMLKGVFKHPVKEEIKNKPYRPEPLMKKVKSSKADMQAAFDVRD